MAALRAVYYRYRQLWKCKNKKECTVLIWLDKIVGGLDHECEPIRWHFTEALAVMWIMFFQ